MTNWDVVVIGAGPAGAVAAREMARRNHSVLLVDKAVFPRPKVCGACLNRQALESLKSIGIGDLPWRLGAKPLIRMMLSQSGQHALIPLPGGASLSREALDLALIQEAVQAGAVFYPRTTARVDQVSHEVTISLAQSGRKFFARAGKVVIADGLSGTALGEEPRLRFISAPDSLVGIGTTVEEPSEFYGEETIYMGWARQGYVGSVRIEDGRLNLAAAMKPQFLKSLGPQKAVSQIFQEAGFPLIKSLNGAKWQGTVSLTRKRRPVVSHPIFFVGDSAGYAEPFTGEGMALAFASAIRLATLLGERCPPKTHHANQWKKWNGQFVEGRLRRCRRVTHLLRSSTLTHLLIWVLSRYPAFAGFLAKQFSKP